MFCAKRPQPMKPNKHLTTKLAMALAALACTSTVVWAQSQGPQGTPALWLRTYGLNGDPAAAELADPDGDRVPSWQEYVAGTDPTNAGSVLKLSVSVSGGGAVRLNFPTGWARLYQVESSAGLPTWTPVGQPVLGEGQPATVLDTQPWVGPGGRFYRVRALGPSVPPGFVWLPPGTFTMGSPVGEPGHNADEGPQTQVTLTREFWIGKCEVTQREYLAAMGTNPAAFIGDLDLPVETVSWGEATNYCARLTARERAAGRLPRDYVYTLPTEAQWEYAGRAGTTAATAFGPSLGSAQANFDGRYPYNWAPVGPYLGATAKTASYAPNAWGLCDLHGNVNEHCLDWYTNSLPGGSVTDPLGPVGGEIKVARGGCWDMRGSVSRSASRLNGFPDAAGEYLGFRVVLAPVPPQRFAVAAAVYPAGAGTVAPAGGAVGIVGQAVAIAAAEFGRDSLFYKWTCSEGAELMDADSAQSAVRLTPGSPATVVTVTAHFLTRQPTGSPGTFTSSYNETLSDVDYTASHQAHFSAKLAFLHPDESVDAKATLTMTFGRGMAYVEHAFSDDPGLIVGAQAGSATFNEYPPGDNDVSATTTLRWGKSELSVDYKIQPPADFSLADVYAEVYRRGGGNPFTINSDQVAGIPAAVVVEGSNWCSVWVAEGGLSYSGLAQSTPTARLDNDLVAWELSGGGTFAQYAWRAPLGTPGSPVVGGEPKAQGLAARAATRPLPTARAAKSGENPDPGVPTRFFLTGAAVGQSVAPGFVQAPFFFGGKVYAVSRPSNASLDRNQAIFTPGRIDGTGKFNLEAMGSFARPLGDPKTAMFGTAERCTTCVFNGVVYLFYDVNYGDNKLFKIYSCSTTAPESTWDNNGFVKTSWGDVMGAYSWLGAWRHTPLKAVVFNGKIYLVVGATEGRFLLLSSADAKTWSWVATLDDAKSWNDEFLPEMSACVVSRKGQSMLCVTIMGTRTYQDWTYVRFFDANNRLEGGYHRHMDWVSPHHGVGVAAGSVKGSVQGQAVQIFAQNSVWPLFDGPPRRFALDVESGASQDWMDVRSSTASRDSFIIPCDAVEATAPAPGGAPGDVRKYIVLFNMVGLNPVGQWIDAIVYESDYYQAGPNSTLNTADAAKADPGCWSLVGVVDGAPPFTRNGNPGGGSMSAVTYGRSQSTSTNFDLEIECEIFAEAGLSAEAYTKKKSAGGEFSMGVSLKTLLAVATGYKETLDTKWSTSLESMATNRNGSLGYLVYAKPTLSSRRYAVCTQDRSIKLAAFNLVNVSSVLFDPVPYRLAAPPAGMTARQPTSDLVYWKDLRGDLLSYDSRYVEFHEHGFAVTPIGKPDFTITKTVSTSTSIKGALTLEISGKGQLSLGLGLGASAEGRASTTVELVTSTSTKLGESVRVKMDELPEPGPEAGVTIDKLLINAAWYLPRPNVSAKDILPAPDWIPTARLGQAQAPWLITWKVLAIE